jgi:hypothetical protein
MAAVTIELMAFPFLASRYNASRNRQRKTAQGEDT